MSTPEIIFEVTKDESGTADRNRRIVAEYVSTDITMSDLGRKYDISRERIRQIIRRAGVTKTNRPDRSETRFCIHCKSPIIRTASRCSKYSASTCGRACRGRLAYDLRLSGLTWKEVARRMHLAHLQSAFSTARGFALSRNLPWPIRNPGSKQH